MKGLDDFVKLKFPSLLHVEYAPLVHQHLTHLCPIAQHPMGNYLKDRVAILKESPLARATHLRRLPYEAAYGGMMSIDE